MRQVLFGILAIWFSSLSAGIVFKGKATGLEGKTIKIYHYTDYITFQKKIIGNAIVNHKGQFEFSWKHPFDDYLEYVIEIDNIKVSCYFNDNKVYYAEISPVKDEKSNSMVSLAITFPFLPQNDPNHIIATFEDDYQNFLIDIQAFIKKQDRRNIYGKYIVFKKNINEKFQSVNNPFAKNYILFSLLDLEAIFEFFPKKKDNEKHLSEEVICYDRYLKSSPVLPYHPAYMNYIYNLWKGKFATLRLEKGLIFMGSINQKLPYKEFKNKLMQSPPFKRDTLGGLLWIKGLKEVYFNELVDSAYTSQLLWDISKDPQMPYIVKNHALLTIQWIVNQKHSPSIQLPDWNFQDTALQNIRLSSFKNKPIYFHFWNFDSRSSVKAFLLMQDLVNKYRNKIHFVSVFCGNDKTRWKKFLSVYSFDWNQLTVESTDHLAPLTIIQFPAYLLVSDQLEIIAWPAPPPAISSLEKSDSPTSIEWIFQTLISNK